MRRIATLTATLALATALVAGLPGSGSTAQPGGPSQVRAVGATPVLTGLAFPAAFTLDSSGRIFYGERFTGEIHIYDPATGQDTLFFTVTDLSIIGEQGLLGLALAPNYPTQPYVFAYATRTKNGDLRNQILRINDAGGTGTNARVIWTGTTVAGSYHDGGRIMFGPDGKLYAIVGEGHDSSNAQDLTNDEGKLLRMKASGGVPPGNPFPGSRIWAYGVRNSYGFNVDPLTGRFWETENGPECNDELNLMQKGENHGWGPSETCSTPPPPPQNTNQDGPSPVLPQQFFSPTIAPTGLAFCVACGIATAEGAFFFGSFNDSRIRQATLNGARNLITGVVVAYTHSGFVLSVERGPSGTVFFSDASGVWKLIST